MKRSNFFKKSTVRAFTDGYFFAEKGKKQQKIPPRGAPAQIGREGRQMQYKEWFNAWLELYVKVSAKERTYLKYRRQAEKYLLPALGAFDVNDLTAVELQKFSSSLTESGLSPGSVGFIVAVLKASLRKGAAVGVIERQYSDAIVRPKIRAGKANCFSKEEQKKIERYVLSKREPVLSGILLSLYTGLRIGELLALTWEDVDLKRGTVNVTRSCHDSWKQGRYVKIFDTTKTQSSERVIPLPKQIIGYMRLVKRTTGKKYVVAGRSDYGAEVRTYQRTFAIVLKKLEIEHRGFHALRHTFATRALEVGMDVKTLSEILGHRDPAVTLRRYAHSLTEHKSEMMNRLGRLFG